MQDIKPGTTVNIKVVKAPTNEAASKTLIRLLSKDPAIKAEEARHRKIREKKLVLKQRGGRLDWAVRLPKQRTLQGALGESGTIRATTDVIRDLGSVERFVEVSAV